MRPLLILPSLCCFPILPLAAAVTPQDIAEELDSPAGITWQAEGPDADSWNVIGDLYANVSSARPGPRRLTASFTGPAVISLNTVISGNATGRILVDGVASGGFLGAIVRDRVQVGSGAHEVTWEFTPRAGASANVKLNGLEWIPGTAGAPLQSGANGPSVTLTGPWAGQTAFHYKDGAAAWSGIVLSALPGEVPPDVELRGDFTGPGVLSYRAHGRDGEGRFLLDDGDWTELGLRWSRPWTRRFMRVGPGQHVARWAPVREVSDFRYATDMMVDEVQIRPEVDIATALETPARIWTAALTGTDQAFGMEMEETSDGAGVALQGEAVISTPVTEGQILRMRVRGDLRFLGHQGEELPVHLVEQEAETTDGPWRTVAIRVSQTGTMTIGSGTGTGGVVDKVEVMEMPADIAPFLGLPENAFSTGGAPWRIALDETVGQYVLQSETSAEEPEAWLDIPVTGPALVRIGFKVNSTGRELRMLVDGKQAWDSSGDGWVTQHAQEVKIEIPAGVHTLRCHAKTSYPFGPVKLLGVEISPLAGGGLDGNAADDAIWAYSGGWERTDAVDHDGGGAIRPVAFTRYGKGMPVLRRLFSGPGTLRFHRYLEEDGLSNSSTYWVMKDDRGYEATERSSYSNYGWGDEWERWYPQGEHWFEWSASRIDGTVPKLVLDTIGFTPSETIDLAAASGAAGLVWQNDALLPWSGVRKEAGEPPVVVSPPLWAGESTAISTVVDGPGIVSFRWKAGGRLQAVGRFYINDEPVAEVYRAGTEITVTLMVEQTGPVKLEWRAEESNRGDWIEIRDFKWSEWRESTLASALDAGPEVTWTTSSPNPFTGRPHHDSEGGTAACLSLEPGGESWLEATVEGPGLFDFHVLGGPGFGEAGSISASDWELHVDGEKVALSGESWPAQWIEGPGTHRIRLVFRVPSHLSGSYAVAVDHVSWQPLAMAVPDPAWTTSSPGHMHEYQDGGKDGAAQVVLRAKQFAGEQWMERTVTGPTLLEWDSQITLPGLPWARQFTMSVNGVRVEEAGDLPDMVFPEGREHRRLSLPSGEHVVRWSINGMGTGMLMPGMDLGTAWQISGLAATPGVTPFHLAVDDSSMAWLETSLGTTVTGTSAYDQEDAWHLPEGGEVRLINITGQGLRACGFRRDVGGMAWTPHAAWVPAGNSALWETNMPYGFSTTGRQSVIDAFSVTLIPPATLAAALDLPTEITAAGWTGIAYPPEAQDGVDSAWSSLPVSGQRSHELPLVVTGPGRIRFHWRHTGSGALTARVDGKIIALPVPGAAWKEAEVMVDEGIHKISWVNETGAYDLVSDAWVDQVVVTSLPVRTLDDVAVIGSALPLGNSVSTPLSALWKPASYPDVSGQWRDAARCLTGASALKATITGPAVLQFRGRCAAPAASPPSGGSGGGDSGNVSVIVIGGGGGSGSTRWFLAANVGGRELARIPAGAWSEAAISIPAGTHEVTWRVMAAYESPGSLSRYRYEPATAEIEGWVDDIMLQTPRAHFDAWADTHQLPAGLRAPAEDADGDGVNNFTEYAFGSNPASAGSRPPELKGFLQRGFFRPAGSPDMTEIDRTFHMQVPYLGAFAHAEIQSSPDLVTWTPRPETVPDGVGVWPGVLTSGVVLPGPGTYIRVPAENPASTETHHLLSMPVPLDDGPRFFRMKLTLPE